MFNPAWEMGFRFDRVAPGEQVAFTETRFILTKANETDRCQRSAWSS